MLRMKAPHGALSASIEGTQYNVQDGIVEVENHHARHLLPQGFELLDGVHPENVIRGDHISYVEKAAAPVVLRATEDAASVVVEGTKYTVEGGYVTVPAKTAQLLTGHGNGFVKAEASEIEALIAAEEAKTEAAQEPAMKDVDAEKKPAIAAEDADKESVKETDTEASEADFDAALS